MAKVIMCWPPIISDKGFPTAGQNRQVQFFRDPTFIYPIIPALFSTLIAKSGNEILWLDAIAEQMNDVEFGQILVQSPPDWIVFEASTPLIKRYWEVINGIKTNMPDVKIILVGEHATARPEECRENCKADYILQGGKWYFEAFKIITGNDLPKETALPHINRDLTRWWLYAYKNGNFKFIPGTYIMAAQDCWHRPGCTFCSWGEYHKEFVVRPVEDVLQEVEELIQFGFKEIYDDSGTFPTGEWLESFCKGMIERGYNDYISFGCNMRFGALKESDFALMAKAGFRMVLFGFESANQATIDRLNKGYNVKSVMQDLILAKAAGLHSHLTVMFGYPWETYQDAKRTYDMVRWLLIKDWAFSAQATICIPYPGTPLWKECKENGWLLSEDWSEYDMSKAIMKTPFTEKELFKLQKGIYNIAYHPKFLFNKIKAVKNFEDFKYYLRIGRKIYDRFGNVSTIGKAVAE